MTAAQPIHGESNIIPIGPICFAQGGTAASGDWLLWQLADSAFPTGGFAHSGGMEAAWQLREIRDAAELAAFIRAALTQTGRSALPFMTAAHGETARCAELDDLLDAFLTNHVSNRASRLQGRALLAAAGRIYTAAPAAQSQTAPEEFPFGHFAVAFGTVARTLGLDRLRASRLFLFWHLRGWISAAVRLGITGPFEGQAIQYSLGAYSEDILNRCIGLTVEDAAQTAPLIDLLQGMQDRLYSRLFQS